MTPEEIAAKEAATAAAKKAEDDKKTPPPDPLKKELERVLTTQRTEREKLLFNQKKIKERLAKLNEEEGIEPPSEDDDAPVTVGMLKKIQHEGVQKTALELAEAITDPDERDLTKYHLSNTIRSVGDPKKDLETAQAIVFSVKNKQLLEEQARKGQPRNRGSGSGAPAKREEAFEPTAEESVFMKPPFNLSKEKIIAAREKEKAKAQ